MVEFTSLYIIGAVNELMWNVNKRPIDSPTSALSALMIAATWPIATLLRIVVKIGT